MSRRTDWLTGGTEARQRLTVTRELAAEIELHSDVCPLLKSQLEQFIVMNEEASRQARKLLEIVNKELAP